MNPNFESHVNFTKEKIYTLSSLKKIGIVTDIFQLKSLLVQCLMQRVNKSRKNALKNNKVQNPFIPNNIIESTGELLAQRYLKKIYNLSNGECKKSYIIFLNNLDEAKFDSVYKILIEKTISIKKYLIDNIDKIDVKFRNKLINS